MKKNKIRTADELCVALYKIESAVDLVAMSRRCEDITTELHALGNALHTAGLHRQGTAADVAVGILEDITEDLKNGC